MKNIIIAIVLLAANSLRAESWVKYSYGNAVSIRFDYYAGTTGRANENPFSAIFTVRSNEIYLATFVLFWEGASPSYGYVVDYNADYLSPSDVDGDFDGNYMDEGEGYFYVMIPFMGMIEVDAGTSAEYHTGGISNKTEDTNFGIYQGAEDDCSLECSFSFN